MVELEGLNTAVLYRKSSSHKRFSGKYSASQYMF